LGLWTQCSTPALCPTLIHTCIPRRRASLTLVVFLPFPCLCYTRTPGNTILRFLGRGCFISFCKSGPFLITGFRHSSSACELPFPHKPVVPFFKNDSFSPPIYSPLRIPSKPRVYFSLPPHPISLPWLFDVQFS